jgi:hypothetical protein
LNCLFGSGGIPMAWSGSYESLRQYLRDFTNIGGDPAYDTNGVLMLLLALADNLRECGTAEADLPELAETITTEQVAFLRRLVQWREERGAAEPDGAPDTGRDIG